MLKAFRALGPFVLVAGLLAAAPAQAQKIGVVNVDRLVLESPQYEALAQALETEFAPKQRELLTLQQQLQEKQQRYERDRSVLSDQERTTLERELRDGARELQRQSGVLEEDINLRHQEQLGQVQRTVLQALQEYAERQRYDLVLTAAVVPYAGDNLDITSAVLEQLRRN